MKLTSCLALLGLALTAHGSAVARDPVKLLVALEQMRGHLDASLTLYQAGQRAVAGQHANHPADELFGAVKNDLSPELRARFERDARRVSAAIAANRPLSDVRRAATAFGADIDAAQASVPGRGEAKTVAQVVSALLAGSAAEYAGGVSGGKITRPAEYQDARAYLARARALLAGQAPALPADQGGQAAQAAAKIERLMAGQASADQIAAQVKFARGELGEISDVALAAGASGAEFDQIEALLAQAKTHYAGGLADMAEEALIGAYLDHFENLEGPLAARDKALEAKLERTLRDQLRALVKQGASRAQFTSAVDAARRDLARARELLE